MISLLRPLRRMLNSSALTLITFTVLRACVLRTDLGDAIQCVPCLNTMCTVFEYIAHITCVSRDSLGSGRSIVVDKRFKCDLRGKKRVERKKKEGRKKHS